MKGFLEKVDEMYDHADEEGLQWEAFLRTLHDVHGDALVTSRDIAESIKQHTTLQDLLPDEFGNPITYDGEIDSRFTRQLGSELRKKLGTRFGKSQVFIIREDDKHRKVALWKVVYGDAGTCGGITNQSENQ